MSRGPLALAAAGPLHPDLLRLLQLLALRWPVEPAALADDRAALVHVEGAHLASRPDVSWVAVAHSADRVRDARRDGASLVLALPGSEAAAAGARPLPTGDGLPDARPVSPFVRARLRSLRSLPDAVAVGRADGWSWDGLDAPVEGTGDVRVPTHPAALAPAVLATGDALLTALAWGAPTVTDAQSAEAAGAVPGRDVVVAGAGRGLPAARQLAARDVRCAALSWVGRRAYETRHDPRRLALDVLSALGLDRSSGARPHHRLEHAVDELGAPPGSPVRDRVYQRATGSLPAPPAGLPPAPPAGLPPTPPPPQEAS